MSIAHLSVARQLKARYNRSNKQMPVLTQNFWMEDQGMEQVKERTVSYQKELEDLRKKASEKISRLSDEDCADILLILKERGVL